MAPKQPKFVAYYRVSTAKQGASGLGLEAQQEMVREMVASRSGRLIYSYTEIESGKRDDRPQLAKALKRCSASHAKIIVARLDRLSRSAAFLHTLHDKGTGIVASDLPGEEADPLLLGVMAGYAQKERERISQRTREALAAAKARGQKLGGHRAGSAEIALYQRQGVAAAKAKADEAAQRVTDAVAEARTAGAQSLREIAAHLTDAGIETRRGKAWTATAVSRVLARL